MADQMDVHVQKLAAPISLESYVAGVVTAENGMAAHGALQAQAVAARTFLLRAMRDDPLLGTAQKPIPSSQRFQVYSAKPSTKAIQATAETAGVVCRYKGQLTICNYVAGAYWNAAGQRREDPTGTEKWVTYNEGKTGAQVKPTPLSNTSRTDNRGCMSQNGADWLARNGYDYTSILRYFYGADLDVGPLRPLPVGPTFPVEPPGQGAYPPASSTGAESSSPAPFIVLALTLLSEGGGR
ncbi:MAG: SpoIID/LytB domain-containing protein [Polyangiaceae bacterium]